MRTIDVQGTGKITASPDTIQVDFTILTLDRDYQKMMEIATYNSNLLTSRLMEIGFKEEDIKTTSFTIDAKYDQIHANNNSKDVFVGYETRQQFRLKFPLDMNLLTNTLQVITDNIFSPELRISFTLKDESKLQEKLLENAVNDAINKAKILTKASNVSLGEIQNINYNAKNFVFYSETMYSPKIMESFDAINLVPVNIELIDHVNITFSIN